MITGIVSREMSLHKLNGAYVPFTVIVSLGLQLLATVQATDVKVKGVYHNLSVKRQFAGVLKDQL